MCRGVHPRTVFPADASPPTSWVVHHTIVCVCVCACVYVRACVCVCVHVCV